MFFVLISLLRRLVKAMGGVTSCFRSRVARPLSEEEMNELMKISGMDEDELNDWSSRFQTCYPYGYLTWEEFLRFYEDYQDEFYPEMNSSLRQFFSLLDLNNDQKLDFYEFGLFYLLIHQGSREEKLQSLCRFYQREKKERSWTKKEFKVLLRNLFCLFDIPLSHSDFQRLINETFSHSNLDSPTDRINWRQFTSFILQFSSSTDIDALLSSSQQF